MSSRPPPNGLNSRIRMPCESPYSCGSPPLHRHWELSVPSQAPMSLNVYQTDCVNPFYVFGGPGNYSLNYGVVDHGHEHSRHSQQSHSSGGQPPIPPESQNIRNVLAPLPRFPTPAAPSGNPRNGPAPFSFSTCPRAPTSPPVAEDRQRQHPLTSTRSLTPIRPDPFDQQYLFGREIPSVPSSALRSITTRDPKVNDTTPNRK